MSGTVLQRIAPLELLGTLFNAPKQSPHANTLILVWFRRIRSMRLSFVFCKSVGELVWTHSFLFLLCNAWAKIPSTPVLLHDAPTLLLNLGLSIRNFTVLASFRDLIQLASNVGRELLHFCVGIFSTFTVRAGIFILEVYRQGMLVGEFHSVNLPRGE